MPNSLTKFITKGSLVTIAGYSYIGGDVACSVSDVLDDHFELLVYPDSKSPSKLAIPYSSIIFIRPDRNPILIQIMENPERVKNVKVV